VFPVGSSGTITKVAFIRLPCVTHDFDQNQTYIPLSFSQSGSTITITTPTSANICPPGHYMLFVLNDVGVPSVASIVRVKNVLPPPPAAPTGLTATGGVGEVSLSWNPVSSASYNVKRGTQSGGPYTIIASSVATPSYEDGTGTPGTTYYYVVSAVNSGGESPNSNQASGTSTLPSNGNGTGLTGKYYDAKNLTMLKLTRVDPTVNFNWGLGSPDPSIGVDTFSVKWTGFVQPRYGQTYTFHATVDDGVRLTVNGVQIINHWIDGGAAEYTGTIALQANTQYTIQMDYYDNTQNASAKLEWSSPSQVREVIPQSQLYP
jgi:hypothetical protein